MPSHSKKNPFFLLMALIFTAIFFSDFAQASFWDAIRVWVITNPLEVNVSVPIETEIGKVFQVEAKVKNKGEEKIENVRGEIFLPEGLVLLRKNPIQETGIIPGKKEKKIVWQIRGEKIGSYIIAVSVFGELRGYGISAEDSSKVEVKESLRGVQPREWFRNLLDFFQGWFRF